MVEYRMRLLDAIFQKDMSCDTMLEIGQVLTLYPEREKEKVAKRLYEIVSDSDSETQALKMIHQEYS